MTDWLIYKYTLYKNWVDLENAHESEAFIQFDCSVYSLIIVLHLSIYSKMMKHHHGEAEAICLSRSYCVEKFPLSRSWGGHLKTSRHLLSSYTYNNLPSKRFSIPSTVLATWPITTVNTALAANKQLKHKKIDW